MNIHPAGGCIHPAGNRMQDISRAVKRAKRVGEGFYIHLYFPVSELILCSYCLLIVMHLSFPQPMCFSGLASSFMHIAPVSPGAT